jgi:hypothetical protein
MLVVQGGHAFALIMLATVLLAIAGPMIHAARQRRQRSGGDRHTLGAPKPSIVSRSDSRASMARAQSVQTARRQRQSSRDQTEDVALTLQRLINEMETRRSAPPNGARKRNDFRFEPASAAGAARAETSPNFAFMPGAEIRWH